jgi:lysozyme family protein
MSFESSLAFAWRPENDGQGYHNTPGDRGGPTAWGVTDAVWLWWCHCHARNLPLGALQQLETATQAELRPIYQAAYYNAVRAPEVAEGLDVVLFDSAVLHGPGNAVRFLQLGLMLAGPDVDGNFGPNTMAQLLRNKTADVIRRTTAARDAHCRANSHPSDLRGHLRRAADCQVYALRHVVGEDDQEHMHASVGA